MILPGKSRVHGQDPLPIPPSPPYFPRRFRWERTLASMMTSRQYVERILLSFLRILILHHNSDPYLGAFAKLRKATNSFVLSVCSSVRMEQLGFH